MSDWSCLLKDRVILITGGAGWIARHIAQRCFQHGARLILADRDLNIVENLIKEIFSVDEISDRIFPVQINVEDEKSIEQGIQLAINKWKTIDSLVNTATIFPLGEVENVSADQWTEGWNVNVRGYALVIKHLVPILKEKKNGSIVNFASTAGLIGIANFLPYATTKGAIIQMSRNLALDLGQFNIRVNSISPGAVDSPQLLRTAESAGLTKEEFDREHEGKCLHRLCSPDEMANLTVFLLSDLCPFMTGANLIVDGGTTTV